MKYVALLRGVNVGAGARVPMGTLKSLFESLGFTGVSTYLNSGNAVFCADLSRPEVTRLIEDALERAFGQPVAVLVKTSAEIVAIADSILATWASGPGEQTYVAYLFDDFDDPGLLDDLPIKRDYMNIYYTPGAIVWNIKRADYNRSHITKIATHPSYGSMTTRNVNTARKLARL
jgi:uncharacterized protein (DUF1697 family)